MSSDTVQNGYQNGHHKDRAEVRNEVLELTRQRNNIEKEIKEYQQILQSHGVGMDDSLVDNEGFPRNDIDIYTVRQARNKIICLNNDIRNVMTKIEDKLADYFVSE